MNKNTSWENTKEWYNSIVGQKGHYFHQSVIIPNSLRLLDLKENSRLVDLACGQGVLERNMPKNIYYLGVDSSTGLIKTANDLCKSKNHSFITSDIAKPLMIENKFTHAAIILALQNIDNIFGVFENASKVLTNEGKLLIVINHPFSRIPRHSSWEVDQKNKTIYRKTNKYLSILKIPVLLNPSLGEKSQKTTSYHYPLSQIINMLSVNGFLISKIEEWVSDKKSVGKNAHAENKAREEFPLFMAILAIKKT